jgi:hypothetical protein
VALVEREGRLAVVRAHDRPALLLEIQLEELDDVPLVVDDQDGLHGPQDTKPCRAVRRVM